MYCRECGNQILNNTFKCANCGTKAGEGFEFCNNCGQLTSEKMKNCRHCGAKLYTIVPQKILKERAVDLQNSAKFVKKIHSVLKFICISSVVATVLLILILVLRPQPDNIPDPRKSDEFLRIGNSYYYDSSYVSADVAEYWAQGRALISSIISTFSCFVVSFIARFSAKKSYKKLLAELEEAKKCIVERVETR